MIPEFPRFKRIELSDRYDIESFAMRFPPYSDFDFTMMWCWDVSKKVRVSELHGNLVLITQDLVSGDLVCSYLGDNNINQTIMRLVEYCSDSSTEPVRLALVPEVSLSGIDHSRYYLEVDLNNSEYVYNLQSISTYYEGKFHKKRKLAEQFTFRFPDSEVIQMDVYDAGVQREILSLNKGWLKQRETSGFLTTQYREDAAMNSFFSQKIDNLSSIGVKYKGSLIAYIISRIINNNYAIGLFSKFDRSFTGLNEYLMRQCAIELLKANCTLYNAGEDLGYPGLRVSKSSYYPSLALRKYSVYQL